MSTKRKTRIMKDEEFMDYISDPLNFLDEARWQPMDDYIRSFWEGLREELGKMTGREMIGRTCNKGDYPELTDQLLEAEVEARKEVNGK